MGSPLKGLPGVCLLFQMILLRAVTRDRGQGTGDQRDRRRLLPQLPQLPQSAPDLSAQMQRFSTPGHHHQHHHLHHQRHHHHKHHHLSPPLPVPPCPHSYRCQVKCSILATQTSDIGHSRQWLGLHHQRLHSASTNTTAPGFGQMMNVLCA